MVSKPRQLLNATPDINPLVVDGHAHARSQGACNLNMMAPTLSCTYWLSGVQVSACVKGIEYVD